MDPRSIQSIKAAAKRGPRMVRQVSAEYVATLAGCAPHLSPELLAKVKTEVLRMGNNGTRHGFKFAQKMFERSSRAEKCMGTASR